MHPSNIDENTYIDLTNPIGAHYLFEQWRDAALDYSHCKSSEFIPNKDPQAINPNWSKQF